MRPYFGLGLRMAFLERVWEDDEVRVGRVSDLTGQQKEMTVGIVLEGSGMQVGRRTGGVMGMILKV